MTPHLKAALKDMGVTGREFAALTGMSEDTISGWGKKVRQNRGVQAEPPWASLLVSAWRSHPELLAQARERLEQIASETP